MSVHSFDTDVAAMVGTTAATIAYNIKHWCEKNAANGKHEHDGRYWTYNSVDAFESLFPYLTKSQIRTALGKLERAGLVLIGEYNKQARDQTKWYSFEPEAVVTIANCEKSQMHLSEMATPFAKNRRPLPDSKPDNKPTTNVVVGAQSADTQPEQPKRKVAKKTARRASRISDNWAPTPKDYAYATSKGLSPQEINDEADRFRNHWISATKNSTKSDWEATWRTWISKPEFGPVARKQRQAARAGRGSSMASALDRVADQLEFGAYANAGREELHRTQAHADGFGSGGQAEIIDANGDVLARRAF